MSKYQLMAGIENANQKYISGISAGTNKQVEHIYAGSETTPRWTDILSDFLTDNITALTAKDLEGLTTLSYRAFANLTNLEEVYLPSTFTGFDSHFQQYINNINEGAYNEYKCFQNIFEGCTNLKVLHYDSEIANPLYYPIWAGDGCVLCNANQTEVLYVPQGIGGAISFGSSSQRSPITKVHFLNTPNITSINLQYTNITSMNLYDTFENCTGPSQIIFPSVLTEIYGSMRSGTECALTSFNLMTAQGNLTTMHIYPPSDESSTPLIDTSYGAFKNLTTVRLPFLGNTASAGGATLGMIFYMSSSNTTFLSGHYTAQQTYTYNGSTVSNVYAIVPSSFTTLYIYGGALAPYAFANFSSLTTISFGSTDVTFSDHMFSGCTGLTTINWPGTRARWNIAAAVTDFNAGLDHDVTVVCSNTTVILSAGS